ncbi:hypothetical protein Tsubulata_019795 [Turnera subulata]|uniref:Oxidative stress 3 n=1 Tax=Turnera subulata TaxID=218843 RepID=A0A9Q0J8W7_9ROSI|nr:hypothetical protein Tsubulata_019795 [Turnera subulata]
MDKTTGSHHNLVLDLNFGKIHANGGNHDQWMAMEGDDNVSDESTSIGTTSSEKDSTNSNASSCSSDLAEDASSSSPSSTLSSSHAKGPLYELSELMAQLPIKRGLSKFYQGKSQSYTSLASVKCLEDLAKKGTPYRSSSKMKSCKSFAGGLDGQKAYSPKATIAKKASRGSSLLSLGRRVSLVGAGGYRASISVHNNF